MDTSFPTVQSSEPFTPAPARPVPASSGQRRLWFLEQLEPGSPLYNIPYLVRLTGPLDESALGRALELLVARHEALRTRFKAINSEPVQEVQPPGPVALPVTDLRRQPEAERAAELARLVAAEARAPFDLARDLPVRFHLYRLGTNAHALMLVMHHIASDGWSMGILYRDLGQAYDACVHGREPALPALEIQYADFTEWQREYLQGATLQRLATYWRQQLAGAPPLLELPADHARPPIQSHRGATVSRRLPAALVTQLKQLGAAQRVTFFMTLLAGFNTVLHRYTGQADLVVGSPLAGRDRAETEGLVGFFINTILLRTDLSGDPTVTDLLKRVREVALSAFDHREMPYEKLVEELQPARNLSHDPICQVFFALQNMPTAPLRLDSLQLTVEPVYTGTAKSDLTAWAAENEDGTLDVTAEFALDLFRPETIARFLGHFESLLAGMAAQPAARLSQLPLLTAPERAEMLTAWNATERPSPADACLHDLFARQVARTPDATALVFDDEELTYAALAARAAALARRLRAQGIGPDKLVGICIERSLDLVVALLATHQAGGAYVPLDPQYPKERIAYMLEDSGATVLLTQVHLLPLLPPHQATVLCVDDGSGAEVAAESGHEAPSPFGHLADTGTRPEHLAYVLYTSGSTGRPKGVMVTHRNVVNFCTGMDEALDHAPGQPPGVWLAITSISFDISVLELLWTLTRGFKVVVLADTGKLPGRAEARPAVGSARALDFSLFYFASEDGTDSRERYRLLLDGARFADQHGFKAVWTPERHFHSFGGLYPNPAVVGAAIAAVTERIQIRAGSVVSPLHHPARIAEEWAVVDNLSRGRVGISFANGWHDRDFALNPANYADRREVMRRNLDTVRRLWRGEAVEFPGGRGNAVPLKIYPRPVQAELPVWITAAGSPETFRLAGESGAGILTHLLGQDLDDLGRKIRLYREARRAHGHDDGCVTIALHTFVGEDLAAVKEKVRGPLCRYLADSADLLKGLSQALYPGAEMKNLSAEEMNALVDYSFNRYFDLCGLLGTPATCRATLRKLAALGVDEVACLIDFGVPAEDALASLRLLDTVRGDFQREAAAARRPARTFTEQMLRHGVTHLQCTPSFARLLAGSPETLAAMQTLQKLMVGGEALGVDLAARLARELPAALHNMYGPTETTIWSTTSRARGEPNPTGAVDLGRPIANTQVYVLDAHQQPLPAGVPGELWIGGTGVARGYLHRPELTDEKFRPDPFRPGNRVYRTGDLVRWRPDGVLDFLGRIDHQVKLRGHRIELGEIEAALMQHAAVRQAVVVLRTDQPDDPRLVAYVVAGDAGAPAPDALRDYLKQKLPEYMVPSLFVALPQLPLTPNGKVDRKQLPAPTAGAAKAAAGAFAAPQGGAEQAIAAIWRDILHTDPIGVDDNFFDFGGHSLQVVQVQNRLREALGVDVPVLKLFQFPTVRTLARFIDEQAAPGDQTFRDRIEDRIRQRQGGAIRRRALATTQP